MSDINKFHAFSVYLPAIFFFFSFHQFSYSNSTSTTVLIKHVKNIHKIDITTDREELKQQKLTDVFISRSKSKSPLNSRDERFMLARRIALWYSRDLLPLSTVENKGFNDFWNSLNIGIPLPSRHTISVGALDDMYACMKKELIGIISRSKGNVKQKYTILLFYTYIADAFFGVFY